MADRLPPVQHRRKYHPQDTAHGCAERATADLAEAARSAIPNVRRRFENSAASWTERAEMLRRIEDGAASRMSSAAAEFDEEDRPLRPALRGGGQRDDDA